MTIDIIFSIIISIVIIIILHNLFIFFKNNLTTPKIKDFVNKPNKKYREIFNIIENTNNNDSTINNNQTYNNTTNIENIPCISSIDNIDNIDNNNDNKNNSMKLELKNFLNNLASK